MESRRTEIGTNFVLLYNYPPQTDGHTRVKFNTSMWGSLRLGQIIPNGAHFPLEKFWSGTHY